MPDIYLKLGTVRGDSRACGHEGWIELASVQFGPAGKIDTRDNKHPKELVCTKKMDSASPALKQLSLYGEPQPATIDFVNAYADTYLQLQFEGVLVSSFATSVCRDKEACSEPMDSVCLEYTKMRVARFSADIPGATMNFVHDLLSTPVP